MVSLRLLLLLSLSSSALAAPVQNISDFAGLSWGTPKDDARKVMTSKNKATSMGERSKDVMMFSGGTFEDQPVMEWQLNFQDGKFREGAAILQLKGLGQYLALVGELTSRFGKPSVSFEKDGGYRQTNWKLADTGVICTFRPGASGHNEKYKDHITLIYHAERVDSTSKAGLAVPSKPAPNPQHSPGAPAMPLTAGLNDFVGVPWGATKDDARKVMVSKNLTTSMGEPSKDAQIFGGGTFEGQPVMEWQLNFQDGKFCEGAAVLQLKGLDQYLAKKAQFDARFGKPFKSLQKDDGYRQISWKPPGITVLCTFRPSAGGPTEKYKDHITVIYHVNRDAASKVGLGGESAPATEPEYFGTDYGQSN